MNLLFLIDAYFDADKSNDGEALLRAFAPDAVVEDEGRSHADREAIRAWWCETKSKYQDVVEPLTATEEDDNAQRLFERQEPRENAVCWTSYYRTARGRMARWSPRSADRLIYWRNPSSRGDSQFSAK